MLDFYFENLTFLDGVSECGKVKSTSVVLTFLRISMFLARGKKIVPEFLVINAN